jgi:hypothetical protein
MSDESKPSQEDARKLAVTVISDFTCTVGGAAANLTAVISVLLVDGETLDGVQLYLNGNHPNNVPVERAGSPSTPSAGLRLHTFDWQESVSCGSTYKLEAVASISFKKSSGIEEVKCDPC